MEIDEPSSSLEEAAPAEGAGWTGEDGSAPRRAGEARMPFLEHLRELRIRLIRAVIALAAGVTLAYVFARQLFGLLTAPLRAAASGNVLLIGTGIGEAFFTKIKVALVAGLFVASPVVFHEIWRFVAPGLYDNEKRLAKPFVLCATFFFVLGGYFCWRVVFPLGFTFFLRQYRTIGVTPTIRISEYMTFASKLLLAFALTFEMPIFALFLTRLGILDHAMMLKYFRYAVLGIFVVAAALTPPDMVSQFLLAIPLIGLYGLSILVSYLFRAPKDAPVAAGDASPAA